METKELQPGTQFGDYLIQRKLGAGSMGVVYAANSLSLQKVVALKILPSDSMKDEKLLGRFKREASAVVRLTHPNLIQGYDWGELDRIHYFAMEYLEGETLKQKLRSQRRFRPEESLEIVLQIASALQYAGAMGLIHRDIKPENIMLTKNGVAKLCDLGLVKSSDETSQERLTVVGTVLGTPNYMSPEQAMGEDVDIRTDIYSLGITFFQMLTGTTPFNGKTPAEILAKHIREEPPLVNDLIPDMDPRYTHVLDIMIAKKPDQRYQPEELVEELTLLRDGEELTRKSPRVSHSLEQLRGASARYKFAYVCSKEDGLFSRTLTKNKALTYTKVREILDYQEQMARTGIEMSFAEICVEKGYITSEQRKMVQNILEKHLFREEDFLFMRVAFDEGYLTEEQFQEILKYQQKHTQGDIFPKGVDILLEKGYLSAEDVKEINHLVQVKRGAREDDAFSDLVCRAQFLTSGQVRKCFKIQSNNIALHKYRPIKEIMVNKNFLEPAHEKVVFRALRRTALTFESTLKLIQDLRIEEENEKTSDKFGWESLQEQKKIKESIPALLKQAQEFKEQGDNIRARELLQEIISVEFDHAQARKILEEVEELLSSAVDLMYEGGRAFDRQNYEKALRLWEKALKIHPENERMRIKAQEAKKHLSTIKENLRLGQKLFQEKKYKKALQFFQQVLDISEAHDVASKYYEESKYHLTQYHEILAEAQTFLDKKDYKKAIEFYEQALEISSEDQDIFLWIKKAKQKMSEPEVPAQELLSIVQEDSEESASLVPFTDDIFSPSESVSAENAPSEMSTVLSPMEESSTLAIIPATMAILEETPKEEVLFSPELTAIPEEAVVSPELTAIPEEAVGIPEESTVSLPETVHSPQKLSAFEETGVFKLERVPVSFEISPEEPEEKPEVSVEALSPQSPSLPPRIDTATVIDAFNPDSEEEVLNRFKTNLENSSLPLEISLPALELTPPLSHSDSEENKESDIPQPMIDSLMNDDTTNTPEAQEGADTEDSSLQKVSSTTERKGLFSLDASITSSNSDTSSLEALSAGEKVSKHLFNDEEDEIRPLPSKSIFHTGSTMRIVRSDLEAISLGNKDDTIPEKNGEKSLVEALHPDSPTISRALKNEDEIPHLTQRIFKTGTTKVFLTTEPLEPISLVAPEITSAEDPNASAVFLDPLNIAPVPDESEILKENPPSETSSNETLESPLEDTLPETVSEIPIEQESVDSSNSSEEIPVSKESTSDFVSESVALKTPTETFSDPDNEMPAIEELSENTVSSLFENRSSTTDKPTPLEQKQSKISEAETVQEEYPPESIEIKPSSVDSSSELVEEETLITGSGKQNSFFFFMILLGTLIFLLFWFFQS